MQLYIGNKNYSSWSLRPWLVLKAFDLPFEEVKMRLSFTEGSPFKLALEQLGAPAGKVPVLVDPPQERGEDDDEEPLVVWDTLAICEYLAEKFHYEALWPADERLRARARSVCAEMHSGFTALRTHCPMNIEADLPEVGQRLMVVQEALGADLGRIVQMWRGLLTAHGGPWLFGAFSIADAYFAPVCTRIRTYHLPVPEDILAYVQRVFELPAMQEWVAEARAEHDFLDFDEPYRTAGDATPPTSPT